MEALLIPGPNRSLWPFAFVYFIAVCVLFVVVSFALGLLGIDLQSTTALAVGMVLSAVVLIGLALGMARFVFDSPRDALRLVPATLQDTLAACAGIAGLGIAVDSLLALLARAFPSAFDDATMRIIFDAFANTTPTEAVVLTLCISLCPGIAEELGFRGFILRCLEKDMSVPVAVLISSLLFGVLHFNVLQGVGASLLGVYLGFVTWRTGSVVPAMAAHAANNFLSSVHALQYVQGDPLFEPRPWWMTAAGLLVAIVALMRLGRRRPGV
jgi:membrane protease YdiL (CAAX protease family)